MVAPSRSLVVLTLVKLLLDLAVDAGDQRSSNTVRNFKQSSVEDLKLFLCEGEGDRFHYPITASFLTVPELSFISIYPVIGASALPECAPNFSTPVPFGNKNKSIFVSVPFALITTGFPAELDDALM